MGRGGVIEQRHPEEMKYREGELHGHRSLESIRTLICPDTRRQLHAGAARRHPEHCRATGQTSFEDDDQEMRCGVVAKSTNRAARRPMGPTTLVAEAIACIYEALHGGFSVECWRPTRWKDALGSPRFFPACAYSTHRQHHAGAGGPGSTTRARFGLGVRGRGRIPVCRQMYAAGLVQFARPDDRFPKVRLILDPGAAQLTTTRRCGRPAVVRSRRATARSFLKVTPRLNVSTKDCGARPRPETYSRRHPKRRLSRIAWGSKFPANQRAALGPFCKRRRRRRVASVGDRE